MRNDLDAGTHAAHRACELVGVDQHQVGETQDPLLLGFRERKQRMGGVKATLVQYHNLGASHGVKVLKKMQREAIAAHMEHVHRVWH